ncbi:FG-GAP-like repeat-containing protein [Streptomyces sp. ASQP_92]|uniref:FG-GAP-like repeat-containing protein n=1 Tax=Streptomyces sp. ASQP_92 TaxID=2979116 RepID=UPI0021C107BE|nr:FG-GAP-like repeat-containing protein [Streptomyces sp. ASQP_92]MCT9091453.1 FG-GAP-like repeat-containing protein [Streptomyces sp. ASQP_92]
MRRGLLSAAGLAGRPLRRALVAAVALAAVGAVGAAAAQTGQAPAQPAAASQQTALAAPGAATTFPLLARKSNGHLYDYEPKGTGGFQAQVDLGGGFGDATALVQANVSAGGTGNDLYHRVGGTLYYTAEEGADTRIIGGGWDVYNLLVSAGNMGGSADPDLIARDAAGALWLYQGKADGTFQAKIRIGSGGWNGMNQLVGRGDYTGDGKTDLLARGTDGTLYIYPGTGQAVADAALGARITVGKGWETYKQLVSTGDNNGDGKADLIGNDAAGALWLLKGTGDPKAPFAARVQIGTTGWAAFDTLF